MELRQLRHFATLAEEMHFGRAADRLCISQPALSASILRLEENWALRLFERDSKSVRITPSGELMLHYARVMLSHADHTQRYAGSLAEGRLGHLEIGLSGTLLSHELDALLISLRTDVPQIEISIREITSQKQVELLRTGRLDAGLVSFPLAPVGLESIALLDDQFVACLPKHHRLAGQPSLDIAQLRDEGFVMNTRDTASVNYGQMVGMCTAAGFQPRIVVETRHVLSIATLVARGFGVGIVPISLAAVGIPGVAYVPFDRPPPRRHWFFTWSAECDTPGLQTLVERMRALAAMGSKPVAGLQQLKAAV